MSCKAHFQRVGSRECWRWVGAGHRCPVGLVLGIGVGRTAVQPAVSICGVGGGRVGAEQVQVREGVGTAGASAA